MIPMIVLFCCSLGVDMCPGRELPMLPGDTRYYDSVVLQAHDDNEEHAPAHHVEADPPVNFYFMHYEWMVAPRPLLS